MRPVESFYRLSKLSARPPPSLVVPVIGINSNVVVDGVEFHVQTEDLGPRYGHLVTDVFRDGGSVVKSVKLDYSQLTDRSNLQAVLPRLMKAHHAKLIRGLQRGRLDSMPPCVTIHRRTPDEPPHLLELACEAGIEKPSHAALSAPPSTVRSSAQKPREDTRPDGPPSSANVWDRLVEGAHRVYPTVAAQAARSDTKTTSSAWDRALESTRQGAHGTACNVEDARAAALSYTQAQAEMHASNYVTAVVSLAKAIQLAPDNHEYRATLRRVLDWLDENS